MSKNSNDNIGKGKSNAQKQQQSKDKPFANEVLDNYVSSTMDFNSSVSRYFSSHDQSDTSISTDKKLMEILPKLQIVMCNIREKVQEVRDISEINQYHYYELSRLIENNELFNFEEIIKVFQLIKSLLGEKSKDKKASSLEDESYYQMIFAVIKNIYSAKYTETTFTEELKKNSLESLLQDSDSELFSSVGKVAFIKNQQADNAFDIFFPFINNVVPVYSESYNELFEEISTHSVEYAIVPIESEIDGKLQHFLRQIHSYELKITACCDVKVDENGTKTKFALISYSAFNINQSSRLSYKEDEKVYIDFSVNTESNSTILELIYAMSSLLKFANTSIHVINTVASGYIEDSCALYYTVSVEYFNLDFLLFLLSLNYPDINISGIYKTI